MEFSQIEIAAALGTAVLHSLWQGALVYCLFRILAHEVKDPAHVHNAGLLALGLIAAGFVTTVYLCWPAELALASSGADLHSLRSMLAAVPESMADAAPTPWAAYLGYAYGMGVLGYLLGLSFEHFQSQRLLRRERLSLPVAWQAPLDAAVARLRPGLALGISLSHHVTTVVTVGVLKPVVLYPVMLANQLSPAEAEVILLHELAHLRRYDHFLVYVQQLLRALVFFHPAAHLLSRHVDTAREYACDDFVVRHANRKVYAQTLVSLGNHAITSPSNAFAMSIAQTPFSARIHRLFGAQRVTKLPGLLFVLPLVLFTLTLYAIAPSAADGQEAASRATASSRVELNTDTIPATEESVEIRTTVRSQSVTGDRTLPSEADSTKPNKTYEFDTETIVVDAMREMPTQAELRAMVSEAMRNMPTEAELKRIVEDAMKSMPSEAELNRMVADAMRDMPTEAELQRIVEEAMRSIPDGAEIERIIEESREIGETQRQRSDAQREKSVKTRETVRIHRESAEGETDLAERRHELADQRAELARQRRELDEAQRSLDREADELLLTGLPNTDYFINDRPATAEEVKALKPEQITQVDVRKVDGGRDVVKIYLK